ncbi:class I SAM-dependent methyltransferase [Chlorobium ferrooxidans]|uniref:Uncharacterized protein n=1 Tax=Chlorobium ferrooxidans DSM 13031 TaxID=377431 RepID=Q0YTX4_9CHLB|nr:class I SAM-dependent methyltransferase [Chlorobium ferrooxidans]EAT59778.1 hypothetical protein CferDRAFT_1785 [Chlorobium ferrooxidans DSM 13031]
MNLIERNVDVVTGSTNVEVLHSIAEFPVFMGSVDQSFETDLFAEQSWSISRDTGILQLARLIPLDILYQSQHAGAVGGIWMEHHRQFSEFLKSFSPLSVLEVGGAHGILAKLYHAFNPIPWAILEPNPAPVDGCKARFIKGFFDDRFTYPEYFDTVVHSHVFEHIYEPDLFMRHLSGFIAEGKHLVFSVPNMQVMLERKYTNCINFEHTVFLTEPYIEYLLAKHGFKLLAKEYFLEDHSIFYATVRDKAVRPITLPPDLYEKNRQLYLDYVNYHRELITDLNSRIAATPNPLYLFGAHIFAQYLIAFGLDTSRIVSLLDNDPQKQGKRLYGTRLTVCSPKVLREVKEPVVILKAGVYNKEIKEDILGNINPDVLFLE